MWCFFFAFAHDALVYPEVLLSSETFLVVEECFVSPQAMAEMWFPRGTFELPGLNSVGRSPWVVDSRWRDNRDLGGVRSGSLRNARAELMAVCLIV